MASNFADISGALSARLGTMTGLPPVGLENRTLDPTTTVLYVEEACIMGDTEQVATGAAGYDYTTGIYQVTVNAPAGNGKGAALVMADKIADHFKRGTVLTKNSITVTIRSVSIAAALTTDTRYKLPVSITFETYTQPR